MIRSTPKKTVANIRPPYVNLFTVCSGSEADLKSVLGQLQIFGDCRANFDDCPAILYQAPEFAVWQSQRAWN